MKQYNQCPTCKRNKFRIIKGLCQSCYIVEFNRKARPPRKNPINIELTEIQKEFLTGCLLGDGWITNLKYGKKSPSFGIERNRNDLSYLEWQYLFVKNLCLQPLKLRDRYNKTTNKTQYACAFETRHLPSLLELRKLWYPNDIKIVPKNLKLTRLIMQIWHCDDGHLDISSPTSFRMKFATHGFTKDDNLFLISLLKERYGEGFSLAKDHKDKEQYCIKANHEASIIILNDLKQDFPPGMERKFNNSLILAIVHNKKSEKLNEKIVCDLREEFGLLSKNKIKFISQMAKKYKVSTKTIENVLYRKTWKNI